MQNKRTIKLRQADMLGREFIRVSPRNKTAWASCSRVEKVHFKEPGTPKDTRRITNEPNVSTAQGFSSGIIDAAIYVFPIFGFSLTAFATPIALPALYGLAPYQLASTATLEVAAVAGSPAMSALAASGAAATGIGALNHFLSSSVHTPEFANFNKPCNADPRQGKF